MIGRREFGMTGLGAIAALAMKQTAAAQQPRAHGAHGGAFAACAQACTDCQRECDACAHHCAMLLADGKKDHMTTLGTCLDCADFCSAAARIVARQGAFAALICKSCADACAQCGKACAEFPDDKMMAQCAQECRDCEKACREMLTHVAKS